MEENPKVDIEKATSEVRTYIDSKKMDLIDWGYEKIESYPDPDDDNLPELKRFAAMWNDFFSYADTVTEDDGKGFPHEVVERYEAIVSQVEVAVNSDDDFWSRIRGEVLPLYLPPEGKKTDPVVAKKWDDRWKKIKFFYDPVGMEVVTTQMWTNKATKERKRGDVIRKRKLPPGFVIRIL